MRITEKKAKEILDFLARRIDGNGIYLLPTNSKWTSHTFFIHDVFNLRYIHNKLYIRAFYDSYLDLIDVMCHASAAGYEIFTYNKNNNERIVFLPVNCSIEKLLVEYDLNNE